MSTLESADAPPPPSEVVKDSSAKVPAYSTATLSVHADDRLNSNNTDVAPALHVSTTFRYTSDPLKLIPLADEDADLSNPPMVYSRVAAPNTTRLEAILSSITNGHAITYSSGLAAFFAMLTRIKPKVVAIGGGYHGCHGVLDMHTRLTGVKQVDLHDEATWNAAGLGKGDVVHVETPLNPTGIALDLAEFAKKAHARGAYLTVDATFAPPPLQDPFKQGADFIMHSGTKYFGGHSDMLCGVLVTQDRGEWENLWKERIYLGSVMGNMEGWLGIRSLRTLELRVGAQSRNATQLVEWLHNALNEDDNAQTTEGRIISNVVSKVEHASTQFADAEWIKKQMPGGYGPVFAIYMRDMESARALPSKLALLHHATSLGGVESLIEWRTMSDQTCSEKLLRISVGVESFEDLKADLLEGFRRLADEGAGKSKDEGDSGMRTMGINAGVPS